MFYASVTNTCLSMVSKGYRVSIYVMSLLWVKYR